MRDSAGPTWALPIVSWVLLMGVSPARRPPLGLHDDEPAVPRHQQSVWQVRRRGGSAHPHQKKSGAPVFHKMSKRYPLACSLRRGRRPVADDCLKEGSLQHCSATPTRGHTQHPSAARYSQLGGASTTQRLRSICWSSCGPVGSSLQAHSSRCCMCARVRCVWTYLAPEHIF